MSVIRRLQNRPTTDTTKLHFSGFGAKKKLERVWKNQADSGASNEKGLVGRNRVESATLSARSGRDPRRSYERSIRPTHACMNAGGKRAAAREGSSERKLSTRLNAQTSEGQNHLYDWSSEIARPQTCRSEANTALIRPGFHRHNPKQAPNNHSKACIPLTATWKGESGKWNKEQR